MMLTTAIAFALVFAAPLVPTPATPTVQTLVVERTYLKAKPGQREPLAKFIVANWFAMDRVATEQGLFTSYRLSENLDPAADWDFEVAVGYPNADGYQNADVQARFGKIRSQHKTILIDGKGLTDLGKIIRSDRVRPREGN